MPPMTVAEALQALSLHQKRLYGTGGRTGRQPCRRSVEELKDSLLRKAAAIRAARGLSDDDKADARASWSAIGGG